MSATAERSVLGEFSLIGAIDSIAGACLCFEKIGRTLPLRLLADDRAGALRLLFGSRTDGPPALEITNTGPVIPDGQIVPQLREQLLIALDTLETSYGGDAR